MLTLRCRELASMVGTPSRAVWLEGIIGERFNWRVPLFYLFRWWLFGEYPERMNKPWFIGPGLTLYGDMIDATVIGIYIWTWIQWYNGIVTIETMGMWRFPQLKQLSFWGVADWWGGVGCQSQIHLGLNFADGSPRSPLPWWPVSFRISCRCGTSVKKHRVPTNSPSQKLRSVCLSHTGPQLVACCDRRMTSRMLATTLPVIIDFFGTNHRL